ncbi:MAG: hypothetical protein WA045_02560, partial [Nitrospira sp.]
SYAHLSWQVDLWGLPADCNLLPPSLQPTILGHLEDLQVTAGGRDYPPFVSLATCSAASAVMYSLAIQCLYGGGDVITQSQSLVVCP